MKKYLIGLVTLVFIIAMGWIIEGPSQVLAQVSDCDGETGAAYGLCTAYCEAMDCENVGVGDPTDGACEKLFQKYFDKTGDVPPCDPCRDPPAGEIGTLC